MCMDTNGVQTFIKADKRTLIHQFDLAIPIRDMRLLDSATAIHQRGNIAVREGAIVFSIECAPADLDVSAPPRDAIAVRCDTLASHRTCPETEDLA